MLATTVSILQRWQPIPVLIMAVTDLLLIYDQVIQASLPWSLRLMLWLVCRLINNDAYTRSLIYMHTVIRIL